MVKQNEAHRGCQSRRFQNLKGVFLQSNSWKVIKLFARLALAVSFLSAVVDRFGGWGKFGEFAVSWGTMANFQHHVAKLAPWAPAAAIPALSWGVTILEAGLGVLLVAGFQPRRTAWASAVLLLVFAVSMMLFQSVKMTFNFSVLTCAACAWLLYAVSEPASRGTATSD